MRINRQHKNNLTRVDSLKAASNDIESLRRKRKDLEWNISNIFVLFHFLPLLFSFFLPFYLCLGTSFAQGANKLDLPNRINSGGGLNVGRGSAATVAAEARHKRAMGEYKELNDIIDELEENSLLQKASVAAPPAQTQEFDLDNMPPLAYYMLLQKLRQCK